MNALPETTRDPVGKKLRFEIFKRDEFNCQYCGAHPPSVVLEVDHIKPVSAGGDNNPDNLITACFACNRGKGAVELSSVPTSFEKKAEDTAERETQIRGYYDVVQQKKQRLNAEVDLVDEVYSTCVHGYCLSENARVSVRIFIEKLGLPVVIDSMELACSRWSHRDSKIFKYFCGICWNRIRGDA